MTRAGHFAVIYGSLLTDERLFAAATKLRADATHLELIGAVAMLSNWSLATSADGVLRGDGVRVCEVACHVTYDAAFDIMSALREGGLTVRTPEGDTYLKGFETCYASVHKVREQARQRQARKRARDAAK